MLGLVLRAAGAQRVGQVVPELEEPVIQHDHDAADVAGAVPVKIERAGGRVEVFRARSVSFAVEKLHRHEGVKEVANRARVQAEFSSQFRARHMAAAKGGEGAEFNGGQQDLGRPEGKGGLEDSAGINGLTEFCIKRLSVPSRHLTVLPPVLLTHTYYGAGG